MTLPADDAPVYAIRFTHRALADRDAEAARYRSFIGDEIADEWIEGLLDAIATLATMPIRALAPENDRFRYEIRQLTYRRRPHAPTYRILYTLRQDLEEGPTATIFHIRHGARRPITRREAREMEGEL